MDERATFGLSARLFETASARERMTDAALEPFVEPLTLQANRAPAGDSHVAQFSTLDGGVDGVAHTPAYSAASATFNHGFMTRLLG